MGLRASEAQFRPNRWTKPALGARIEPMSGHRCVGRPVLWVVLLGISMLGFLPGCSRGGTEHGRSVARRDSLGRRLARAAGEHKGAPAGHLVSHLFFEATPIPSRKFVCLTFDDGPKPPYTQEILDVLKKEHVKATFFMLGYNVQQWPDLARRVVAEGHAIGNHTFNHAKGHSPEQAAWEVDQAERTIEQVVGVRPTIFRPPYGDLEALVTAYARSKDYTIIMWTVASGDSRRLDTVSNVVRRAMTNPQPGEIVLMHDGGQRDRSRTVAALPRVIHEFKRRGYVFLTIPQMLEECAARQDRAKPQLAPPHARPEHVTTPAIRKT